MTCLRSAASTLLCLAAALLMPSQLHAQPLPLSANYTQLARLAPGATSATLTFDVDSKAKRILLDIGSNLATLTTSIEPPGGGVINEGNVTGLGGTFNKVDGSASTGPLVYPFTGGGMHYIYELPVQLGGSYVVRLGAPSSLSEEAAVIAQLHSDSPIAANLLFTESTVVTGRPTVIAAAVFDATTAVVGATVQVRLLSPTALVSTMSLLDDGGVADGVAGDGLYSGLFTPPAPGSYRAVAEISGVSGGLAFKRQAAATLQVVPGSATLTDTLQARGIDANRNGEIDRIAFDALVNVAVPGKYRIFAHLSAGAKKLVGSGDATLSAGTQTISAFFSTDDLAAQGLGHGPYSVDLLELVFIAGSTVVPADRKIDLGVFSNFVNSAFERDPLALTGVSSDRGVDLNGNGLFDQLRLELQVDVKVAGFYQFSGRLADLFGTQIDLFADSANLVAGLNTIEFRFDGSKIGRRGLNGPYALDSVLIFGKSTSLSVPSQAARTQAYRYTQFDGATRNPADIDSNGLVDCADVAIVKASYGKRTGQPGFDARADLNHDGLVNIADLAIVTRALPVGLACP